MSLCHTLSGDDGRPLPLGTATQLAEYLGVVMARRSVQSTPHDGARKSGRAVVIELGAGCGVVGLVAATHHGATAVLTDRCVEGSGCVRTVQCSVHVGAWARECRYAVRRDNGAHRHVCGMIRMCAV